MAMAAATPTTAHLAIPALGQPTPVWNEATMKLATDNGWGVIPTATNGIWNETTVGAARANGFFQRTMEVATAQTHFPPTNARPPLNEAT